MTLMVWCIYFWLSLVTLWATQDGEAMETEETGPIQQELTNFHHDIFSDHANPFNLLNSTQPLNAPQLGNANNAPSLGLSQTFSQEARASLDTESSTVLSEIEAQTSSKDDARNYFAALMGLPVSESKIIGPKRSASPDPPKSLFSQLSTRKGDWSRIFRLKNGAIIVHEPNGILFEGKKFPKIMEYTPLPFPLHGQIRFPQAVTLIVDSTLDQFMYALACSGLYHEDP